MSEHISSQFENDILQINVHLTKMGGICEDNLKKAIKTAFEDGADYVLEIHADNQYNPNLIIKAKHFLRGFIKSGF